MLDVDDLGSWALTPYRRVRPVRRVPTDPAAIAAIASYVAGGETYATASREFNLGYDQIRAICRAAGVRSDQAQRTGTLSETVRRRIASALIAGQSVAAVARATGVGTGTIYKMRRQLRDSGKLVEKCPKKPPKTP
jgi:transposase-like protein